MSNSEGSGHGSGIRTLNRNANGNGNGDLSLMQDLQHKYAFLENLFSKFWKSIIKSNSNLKLQLRNVKWKNAKAKPGCAYQPTEVSSIHCMCTVHLTPKPHLLYPKKNRSSRWPM